MVKTEQLQLRVSSEQKERIKQQARRAGQDVSAWVLDRLLPPEADEFQQLVDEILRRPDNHALALAEIHDYLVSLSTKTLKAAVRSVDLSRLSSFEANYVAAMVEQACSDKRVRQPEWLKFVVPLRRPWFASELKSLRLHLLTASPPPYRRRNLFVDSTLGDRV